MRKITILIALLFSAFLTIGQPAPELLFTTTEPTPTFISVSGHSELAIVTPGDWLFAFAGDKVYGSKEVMFPTGFVAASGKDQWDAGLEYGQAFYIGLYDSETKQFFQLQGTVTDWLKGVETALKWYPMGLYKYEVTGVGDPVALVADPELAAVKITIDAPPEFVNDGTLFFNITGKNVQNIQVLTNGKGTVTPVKRWITGQGWVNYQYEPTTLDNIIFINAVGQNQFTGALMQAQHTVKIIQKDEPKPVPELIVKHQGEGYKIIIKPYVKDLLAWYFVNTSETAISYRVKLYKDGAVKSMNSGTVNPGDEKRIMPLSMYTDIEVFDLSIDGKRYLINQKLTY